MILGIETSCDETSAAVLEGKKVLSSVVLSQDIHKIWRGVVPILAKRAHQAYIDDVITAAMNEAGLKGHEEIDAIAVTAGPGLAIALEVGIRKALSLGKRWNVPVIPVNHIEGHVYSADLNSGIEWKFPALALILSGGHTELHLMKDHGQYSLIGRTRDDAIGELFDKIGREMGLGYPAGKALDDLARKGNPSYDLPVPMRDSWDFSYSGLKTAALNLLRKGVEPADFARSLMEAAIESVLIKVRRAEEKFKPRMIVVGGGVAANSFLRERLEAVYPEMEFTGDNAAMIARAGWQKIVDGVRIPDKIDRIPRWRLEDGYEPFYRMG